MTQAQPCADEDAFAVSHRLLLVAQVMRDAHAALQSGLDAADGCWGGTGELATWSTEAHAPACATVLAGTEGVAALLSGLSRQADGIALAAAPGTVPSSPDALVPSA
ncbi:hypothetical protein [Catellatospora citrea]|nr:hypothetical protein [Catellatospora citrea]RKE05582.1 hypothetical protein C8E86_0386 [Catellatospora citrea]